MLIRIHHNTHTSLHTPDDYSSEEDMLDEEPPSDQVVRTKMSFAQRTHECLQDAVDGLKEEIEAASLPAGEKMCEDGKNEMEVRKV